MFHECYPQIRMFSVVYFIISQLWAVWCGQNRPQLALGAVVDSAGSQFYGPRKKACFAFN